MLKEKGKQLWETCFSGEIILSKTMLWLIGAICLMVGVNFGLNAALRVCGVSIGGKNGKRSGCICGNCCESEDEEDEEK